MSTDAKLRKADRLLKAGDHAGAEALYRDILNRFPANAAARRGLLSATTGVAPKVAAQQVDPPAPQAQRLTQLAQSGAMAPLAQEAAALARLFPRSVFVLRLLALAQNATGAHDAALATLRRAATLAPRDAGLALMEADIQNGAGRPDEALRAAERCLTLSPGNPQAIAAKARALSDLDRDDEALALVASPPQTPAALNLWIVRGNLHMKALRFEDAAEDFRAALTFAPNHPDILNNLSNVLARQERFAEAATAMEAALAAAPGHPAMSRNLVVTLIAAKRHDDAITLIDRLVAKDPSHRVLLPQKAVCLFELGDREAALATLDDRIAEVGLTENLAAERLRFAPRDIDPDMRDRIEAGADEPDTTGETRQFLHAALFRHFDATGDTDRAFRHMSAANALREADHPFDMDAMERVAAAIMTQIDGSRAAPRSPVSTPRVVFVLGLPRSGTSLVEQILAAHPMVHGAGEISSFRIAMAKEGWTIRDIGAPLDDAMAERIAGHYRESLAQFAISDPVVVDKLPINFLWAGHILSIIPGAQVLWVERDPMAVGWSNLNAQFTGQIYNFGNTQRNMARAIALHARLGDHFAQSFPEGFHRISYDALTEDPEAGIRNIVAKAGLPWDEARSGQPENLSRQQRGLATLRRPPDRAAGCSCRVGAHLSNGRSSLPRPATQA